jgi:hypothetical protein
VDLDARALKAFLAEDGRFFWVDDHVPYKDGMIAATQRDDRVMVSMGGRLGRIEQGKMGKLCISLVWPDRIVPTIYDTIPNDEDIEWYLRTWEPKPIPGEMINITPYLLEEIFKDVHREVG